jgi:CheY-like chemotaxis protein
MNARNTILLVEDDENDVLLFRIGMERAGVQHRLMIVQNGEEALAYLNGQGQYSDRANFPFPSLLITDLKMPRVTGFELLEWLQKNDVGKPVPVIVLSGSILPKDRERALKLRARTFCVKVADIEEIIRLVKEVTDTWLPVPEQPLKVTADDGERA